MARIIYLVIAICTFGTTAHAQVSDWNGSGTCYNCPGSWNQAGDSQLRVPDAPSESAQFGDVTGQTNVVITGPLTFPAGWVFNNTGDYVITSEGLGAVSFTGFGLQTNGSGNVTINMPIGGIGSCRQVWYRHTDFQPTKHLHRRDSVIRRVHVRQRVDRILRRTDNPPRHIPRRYR